MQPTVVVDADDERLDDYRALNDQRFRRAFEGDRLFVAEGLVSVERLLESGHEIRSVLLAPARVERFAPHLPRVAADGAPVYVAEPDVIAAVVGFDLHRGVVAVAKRRPPATLADVIGQATRIAVLEGLNDPENLGAIARAAKAFAIDALILDPTCTDPYSRRTVRVSMGEVLTMPVVRVEDTAAAMGALHGSGFETWAMTPAADADDLWSLHAPSRVAVMLGAEGPGLRAATIGAARRRVRIPIVDDVDSLNVGHAAAVTFAELARADRRHLGNSSPS